MGAFSFGQVVADGVEVLDRALDAAGHEASNGCMSFAQGTITPWIISIADAALHAADIGSVTRLRLKRTDSFLMKS